MGSANRLLPVGSAPQDLLAVTLGESQALLREGDGVVILPSLPRRDALAVEDAAGASVLEMVAEEPSRPLDGRSVPLPADGQRVAKGHRPMLVDEREVIMSELCNPLITGVHHHHRRVLSPTLAAFLLDQRLRLPQQSKRQLKSIFLHVLLLYPRGCGSCSVRMVHERPTIVNTTMHHEQGDKRACCSPLPAWRSGTLAISAARVWSRCAAFPASCRADRWVRTPCALPWRLVAARAQHPIETFRDRLAGLRHYPPGVVPVPATLRGTAFFSAAAGLVIDDPDCPLPAFPFGGVMFVGHNLDCEAAFLRRLASGQAHGGSERVMLTWRNVYRLLGAAGMDARECFFTNAYVGLKVGEDPTGRFPGSGDPDFRAWCRRFLEEQVEVMRPRAIATLGSDARRFMATMAPELIGWSATRNPPPTVVGVTMAGHHISVTALLHPSGYRGSLGRRAYRQRVGLAAEALLLREATNGDGRQRQ